MSFVVGAKLSLLFTMKHCEVYFSGEKKFEVKKSSKFENKK